MALKSNENFLNFSKLTYSEILQQITDRLKDNPKFENFRESAIAQTLMEIFAGTSDMTNYYLERRSEEQFFDTLQLRSSVIQLAKNIGYVVSRPVPASTSLSMTLTGPLPAGIQAGDQISLVQGSTSFIHQGLNYVTPKTYSYTLTNEDVINGVGNENFVKAIEGAVNNISNIELNTLGNIPTSAILPIELKQGDITVQTFLASSPDSPKGKIFQKYKISDTTFSNLYGEEDISYDVSTETYQLASGFTKVGIGIDQATAFDSSNLYEISRRTVLTSETVLNSLSVSANSVQACSINTTTSEGVQIEFADGIIAKKGPVTVNDNLYVQYLSTAGATANQVGVVGDKLTTDTTFYTSISNINVTNNLEFVLSKNITGGADFEDIDSIKFNSPGIYQSLDRLVTAKDYVYYLKSLTNPLDIKNAIAWGEQEEVEAAKAAGEVIVAQKKLFNVVLFSVLGELYYFLNSGESGSRSTSGADANTNMTNTILQGEDYNATDVNDYFNILVAGSSTDGSGVIDQIGDIQTLSASNVYDVTKKLTKKSQITTKNVYITPILQKFILTGDVYVNNLIDLRYMKLTINRKINSFLNENADYNTPIYLSNIVEIIESDTNIIHADVGFSPEAITSASPIITGPLSEDIDISSYITSAAIIPVMEMAISDYVEGSDGSDANTYSNPVSAIEDGANLDISEFLNITLPEEPWSKNFTTESTSHMRMGNFTERTFYTVLMKSMWDSMASESTYGQFRDSDNFKNIMYKLNNGLKLVTRSSMLDSKGNISNFSLPNEVAQIELNLVYRYK